jgi:hypothetical protein
MTVMLRYLEVIFPCINLYFKIIDLTNLESPVVASFDNFDDQVSDMLYLIYRKTLICSSGDGTLLVIDTKKNKIISHTESLDDEITCLTAVKVEFL